MINNSHLLHIGIDASNIRQGGGLTHLRQLLESAVNLLSKKNIRLSVWASRRVLDHLPEHPMISKHSPTVMEGSLPARVWWQLFRLRGELKASQCDLLFSPGGIIPFSPPVPAVTMCQNMLPFEPHEANKFGRWSLMRHKFRLLNWLQGASFRRANGVIFLSRFAMETISKAIPLSNVKKKVIPHGIEPRFLSMDGKCFRKTLSDGPLRLLYVSIVMPYKHQIEVAKAVILLREQGVPATIDFVGAAPGAYGRNFIDFLHHVDPGGTCLNWLGEVSFDKIHNIYDQTDLFVFASGCENMPNILIEAMASGLPVVAADRGSLREFLGPGDNYFNPESVESIYNALLNMTHESNDARLKAGTRNRGRAQTYSWDSCAKATLDFLQDCWRECRV